MSQLDALSDDEILLLPIDRLSLTVLQHLAETKEWNTGNFRNSQGQKRKNPIVAEAMTEAIGWLLSNNLIAHGKPGQSAQDSMIVTRAGREALATGLATLRAGQRLQVDIHPRLRRIQSQFLLGEYELAAFAAMREVEIRVRQLVRADESAIGVSLIKNSFKELGPLADRSLDRGERVAVMELFAGAIGTFKNPPSHRQIDYADPTEASEVVLLADLLLRLLDRVERRLSANGAAEASGP
jgi:uncharacterized protein (TIGR02391 family)